MGLYLGSHCPLMLSPEDSTASFYDVEDPEASMDNSRCLGSCRSSSRKNWSHPGGCDGLDGPPGGSPVDSYTDIPSSSEVQKAQWREKD